MIKRQYYRLFCESTFASRKLNISRWTMYKWIPAFAGMTGEEEMTGEKGMTGEEGMTILGL